MCVKAAACVFFFLLFLCFFMHASASASASASTTPSSSPLPNTVSHSTSLLHTLIKIEKKHYKLNKFDRNGKVVALGHNMLSKSTTICNKYNYKPIKQVDSDAGRSGAVDCKSSHHRQLRFTKSQDLRSHLNDVREMDSQYSSSIFSEENLSETMDYHPPHQKSPIHNK